MRHSASHGRQSSSQHVFSLAPQAHIQRSSFDRSHSHKTTFNEGYLIPIYVDEVLPGDTFNLRLHAICRMTTPIYPIMDNLYFETHFWFVPNRLIWSHWQNFNGAQANPADTTSYIVPVVTSAAGGFTTGSLYDYMGVPPKTANALTVNNLHGRAYNLIYNEWYRDENLQNSVTVDTGDGPDTLANYTVLRRGKRHDYFTSCLPWPQKINDGTVVTVPLGTSAQVIQNPSQPKPTFFVYGGASGNAPLAVTNVGTPPAFWNHGAPGYAGDLAYASGTNATGLLTDLSTATAATVNQLRQAFQLQVLFERDARGGTRYTEIIRSHFGVLDPADAILQRPEYLGGGSQMININPVVQTSVPNAGGAAGDDTNLGTLAAFGVGNVSGHGFTKSFIEHGVLIGIASVRADLTYQQGLHRMWTRSTRYDFYWPALAHIGEQAVALGELYAVGGTVTTDGWSTADAVVFGYQERYAEYRFKPSVVSSLFRSNATGTLDAWHLAQNLSTPALNSTFIVENAPMSRVEATNGYGTDFIADMFFDLKCARPMPLYGDPMQLGRF